MAILRYFSSVAQPTQLTGSISAGSLTMSVASTTGFPSSFPYTLAIDYGGALNELVDVTSAAGLTLTITRAVDGTSAVGHSVGAAVRHVATGRDFADYQTHQNATVVHGTTSAVVGINDLQTLTNKTLTGPVINGATVSGTFAGTPTFSGLVTLSGGIAAGVTVNATANIRGALSSDVAISNRVTGDTNDRLQVTSGGVMNWGPGNAVTDASLSRTAAGELTLSSATALRLANTTDVSLASTAHAFQIGASSGANLRMDGNEIMAANNGATAVLDVQSDGGNLRLFNNTTAALQVQGQTQVNGQNAASNQFLVTGATSQSANLVVFRNSATQSLFSVTPGGAVNVSPDTTATASRPLNVNGPTGLTANLMGLQVNSTDVFTVSATGTVRVAGENPSFSVTPATGWSQSAIVARRFGPILAWSVIMTRTGANISIGANGNMTDTDVFTVPAAQAPLASQFVMFNTATYEGGAFLSSSTNICAIRTGTPSATITTGDDIGFTFCYAIA